MKAGNSYLAMRRHSSWFFAPSALANDLCRPETLSVASSASDFGQVEFASLMRCFGACSVRSRLVALVICSQLKPANSTIQYSAGRDGFLMSTTGVRTEVRRD